MYVYTSVYAYASSYHMYIYIHMCTDMYLHSCICVYIFICRFILKNIEGDVYVYGIGVKTIKALPSKPEIPR